MANFAISYDLNKRKDYPKLWEELKRLKAQRSLESFWLLALNNTADEVCEHLKQFIDEDDFLMIVQFVGKPAFTKAKAGTNAWIAANC